MIYVPARWPVAIVVVLAVLCSIRCGAQDAQFEVASIRLDAPGSRVTGTNLDLDSTDIFRYEGGPVMADGYLVNYIIFAYKLSDPSEYPKLDAQLPKWAKVEARQTFRLEARGGDHPTKDELRGMVRSLLAERFGLKAHTATRSQMAWVLVNTNNRNTNSTLRRHTGDPVCTTVHTQASSPPKLPAGQAIPYCGVLLLHDGNQRERLHLQIMDYTMQQMAGELAQLETRMGSKDDFGELRAVDGTHLPGKFDLDLHYVRRQSTEAVAEPSADPGLDFEQALRSQAGVEFRKQTASVEELVVDQVHEPSPE